MNRLIYIIFYIIIIHQTYIIILQIYFVDISKYKKYNEVFVNILYPKFTKTFIGLLPFFNLTEEELFYLKLNEVDYEIIH